MVADTKLCDYKVGDIVYFLLQDSIGIIKCKRVWIKAQIISFSQLTAKLQDIDNDNEWYTVPLNSVAITEDRYKNMQLEKRFSIW